MLRTPVLIPGKHHIAVLLVRKCHLDVRHQGRHFTEGRVRSSGFWITGCKRLVSSLIHRCVMCRKLRGKLEVQKMSDLPSDRITPGQLPFTSVGIDISGPWEDVTQRTRGGAANSKRWAALFTCLVTRAVHIEVIEKKSASSFINALRRFIALRGKVDIIRSDRGTNFLGSVNPLQINAINVEDGLVKDFLYNSRTTLIFKPPHSSHMGGVWERMIGTTRRILDSMLLKYGSRTLTHEVLTTFLAEVTSIINSRPSVPVSSMRSRHLFLRRRFFSRRRRTRRKQSQFLWTVIRKTCFVNSGNEFSILPPFSGRDGGANTFRHCKLVASGSTKNAILAKATLFFSRRRMLLVMAGLWVSYFVPCRV